MPLSKKEPVSSAEDSAEKELTSPLPVSSPPQRESESGAQVIVFLLLLPPRLTQELVSGIGGPDRALCVR